MEGDALAVGLKFGFLAVLYLFLFTVARSALKDLRRTAEAGGSAARARSSERSGSQQAFPFARRHFCGHIRRPTKRHLPEPGRGSRTG